ncbi:MAG TPA: DinB family protein [Parafilimonas sp.]|nr:DinB family protein [Parafilimonas sp.]
MEKTITELRNIVAEFSKKFHDLSDEELSAERGAGKWTRKEVIGHLVDSAQNNLRRFICGQYEKKPPKIIYMQNFWVSANNYGAMSKEDIITLWKLMNERICAVLQNMNVENYNMNCDTGTEVPELHTLQWLAHDYNRHLKHHLNQIIPDSFDIMYP